MTRATSGTVTPARDYRPPPGCKHCIGTGQREVAWHRSGAGRVLVDVYAAACDCAAGDRLAGGIMARHTSFVAQLHADPKTLAVYYTSAEHPHLAREERYTPEVCQRFYERELAAQQRQRRTA
jgi:hypothetical protein